MKFDTSEVEASRRVAYWRDSICEHHISVEVEVLEESRFGGVLDISGLGHLQVSSSVSKATAYHHRPAHIKADGNDDLIVNQIVEGTATLVQGGQTIVQKPGDLMIYDVSRPYQLSCPGVMHSYVARIPRALMVARNPRMDSASTHIVAGATLAGRLVGAMLRECHAFGGLAAEKETLPKLTASLLDVISTAVETSLGFAATSPGQVNLLERAKRHILANLEDPDQTVESVSTAVGVSPRTLNRAFASEGTTVMRWLWRQRLLASYRALAEGRIRQVTAVAFTFGFSDVSHFSRTFKKEFGISPNTLLH